jgi:hypothetical protein
MLTIVIDGTPVRSYNAPRLDHGRVVAPIEPYVTRIARSIGYDGEALIVRFGDLFAQIPAESAPFPDRYASTYVQLAPIARTLGAAVVFDTQSKTLYVQTPRAVLATPTPFNPAVPRVQPTAVFTPVPQTTPRPNVSGSPLPRRTPIPVQSPASTPSP